MASSTRARRQRDGHHLPALARDRQRPVPALQAQVLDVGAGRFGDAQAVQREQRDQRMLERWAEPGGDQERAELVAVQGDGMRLVLQPRTADVSGWGMLEELFFNHVLVKPGDGAQPPGDGRAGPAPGFEFPGEAFDVGAADGEQRQGTGAAPGGELAQVECVRLAGQAAVPGQEPGKGEPFGIGEGGLDRGERGGWGGGGHRAPPGRAETREAGPVARSQRMKRRTHRRRAQPVTPCHTPPESGRYRPPRNSSRPPTRRAGRSCQTGSWRRPDYPVMCLRLCVWLGRRASASRPRPELVRPAVRQACPQTSRSAGSCHGPGRIRRQPRVVGEDVVADVVYR